MALICANKNCGWTGEVADLLYATHPFDPEDQVTGCPKCLDIGSMEQRCDEPGCMRVASSGMPTPEGYRHVCYTHWQAMAMKKGQGG